MLMFSTSRMTYYTCLISILLLQFKSEVKAESKQVEDIASYLKQTCKEQASFIEQKFPEIDAKQFGDRASKLRSKLSLELLDQYAELDKSMLFLNSYLGLAGVARTCDNHAITSLPGWNEVNAKFKTNSIVQAKLNKNNKDSKIVDAMKGDFIKKTLAFYLLQNNGLAPSLFRKGNDSTWQKELYLTLKAEMPFLLLPSNKVGGMQIEFGRETLSKSLVKSLMSKDDFDKVPAIKELVAALGKDKIHSENEQKEMFEKSLARLVSLSVWSDLTDKLLRSSLSDWQVNLNRVHKTVCEKPENQLIDQLPELMASYVMKNQQIESTAHSLSSSENQSTVLPEWRKDHLFYCNSSWGVTKSMRVESKLKFAALAFFVSATVASLPASSTVASLGLAANGLLIASGGTNLTAHAMRFVRRYKQIDANYTLNPSELNDYNFALFGLSSEVLMAAIYTSGLSVAKQTLLNILKSQETGKLLLGRALFPSFWNGASFEDILTFWIYNFSTTASSALEFMENGINPLLRSEFYIGTIQEYLTSIFVVSSKRLLFDTFRSAIAAYTISNHFEDIWLLHGSKKPDQVLTRFEFGYHGSGISLALRFFYYVTVIHLPKLYAPIKNNLTKNSLKLVVDLAYQVAWAEVYNQIRVKFIEEPKYHKFPFGIWEAFGDTPWGKALLENKQKVQTWMERRLANDEAQIELQQAF